MIHAVCVTVGHLKTSKTVLTVWLRLYPVGITSSRKTGLGIRSSLFQTIRSFFVSERTIRLWKGANRSRRSFVMSDLSESLLVALLSFVKSDRSESLKSHFKKERQIVMGAIRSWAWKGVKNTNFSSDSLVFCEWFAGITTKSLTSLFLKSDESNMLTSLFCKERHERIAYSRSIKWAILSEKAKSKWAKERIHNTAERSLKF